MRVFVYGTLRRGASNAHRMAGGRLVAEGTVGGALIRIGWYPGLVADPGGGSVRGELWEVSAELLAELDRFEGCDPQSGGGIEYQRVMATVRLDDGGEADAWVWKWRGQIDDHPRIAGGDWLGV